MTEVGNLVADRGNHGNKKKMSPQEAWMDLLHGSVDKAPPTIKPHLQQMVTLDNIPRKEKQFRNFASNSLNLKGGAHGQKILDAIWGYLNEQRELLKKQKEEAEQKSKELKEQRQAKDAATETTTKSESASISDNGSNGKSKSEDSVAKNDNNDDKVIYKNVKKESKKLLKKAPGHSMKYKSLQKALREKAGMDKSKIKQVLDQMVVKENKKFLLEGKQIRLIVS